MSCRPGRRIEKEAPGGSGLAGVRATGAAAPRPIGPATHLHRGGQRPHRRSRAEDGEEASAAASEKRGPGAALPVRRDLPVIRDRRSGWRRAGLRSRPNARPWSFRTRRKGWRTTRERRRPGRPRRGPGEGPSTGRCKCRARHAVGSGEDARRSSIGARRGCRSGASAARSGLTSRREAVGRARMDRRRPGVLKRGGEALLHTAGGLGG